MAAGQGRIAVVQFLLDQRADATQIDISSGKRGVQLAAGSSRPNVISQLVVARANPSEADEEGTTALHEACKNGHVKTLRRLLQVRADPTKKDRGDRTPRDLAAERRPAMQFQVFGVCFFCRSCISTFRKNFGFTCEDAGQIAMIFRKC